MNKKEDCIHKYTRLDEQRLGDGTILVTMRCRECGRSLEQWREIEKHIVNPVILTDEQKESLRKRYNEVRKEYKLLMSISKSRKWGYEPQVWYMKGKLSMFEEIFGESIFTKALQDE